jgi:hypothetical protein
MGGPYSRPKQYQSECGGDGHRDRRRHNGNLACGYILNFSLIAGRSDTAKADNRQVGP